MDPSQPEHSALRGGGCMSELDFQLGEQSDGQPIDGFGNDLSEDSGDETSNDSGEEPFQTETDTLEAALGPVHAKALRRVIRQKKELQKQNAILLPLLAGLRARLVQLCYGRCMNGFSIEAGHVFSLCLSSQSCLDESKQQLQHITTQLAEILASLEMSGIRVDELHA